MSPVFRHGKLRLYLLKLLDEAPRHGYEVIRLLQDRFMGVYSPSPGTIYPRLTRLEEEGLVTHDEVNGRKVYRITDKGRAELRARLDDLADLEEELTESVRDIAREVTEDVRETVRSLREELTWAARDVRRQGRDQARQDARERARTAREQVRESARQAREELRDSFADSARSQWADWARSQDWRGWAGWRERPGASGEPGPGGGRPGGRDRPRGQAPPRRPRPDPRLFRDLERLAVDFARELRAAASHTECVGDNALGDLRAILEDTLNRIRDEVFGPAAGDKSEGKTRSRQDSERSDGNDG